MSAENDKIRHDLANGLLEMYDTFGPMLDAAEGHKAEMERRGWSPTAAEQAALAMYLGMLQLSFQRGGAS